MLRKAAVVGMTTTALAHFSALVSAMGVEVIVVEEATEVLEPRGARECAHHIIHLGAKTSSS